jgi:hypothetical protein
MVRLFKFALAFAGVFGASIATFTFVPTAATAADAPPTTQLQDRAAIQNLVVKYTIALDSLNPDMYAGVFADDAEFTFGGNTYNGRAQIRGIVTGLRERNAARPASAAPVPKSYHVLSNTLVEFVSDREAHHRSYWQTISGPSSGPFKWASPTSNPDSR